MITFQDVIGSRISEIQSGNSISVQQLQKIVEQQGFKTFFIALLDSEPEEKCSDIVFFVDNSYVILYWLYG
jgi:hypothetical protein